MSRRVLRVGTRGSALALAQAQLVTAALAAHDVACRVEVITTAGDERTPDTPWGEGAFVGALEQALLAGTIDVAVHSAKDVPTDEDPRLAIVAYLERDDPRDALVLAADAGADQASVEALPRGVRIGTDSPRRVGFMRARRPGLDFRPLHGNVDTRLRRLDEGQVDALVLAAAGLRRLGHGDRISQLIPAEQVPPAPGQGALCVQARADDAELVELGRSLDHRPTRLAVEAERALLAAAGGGCRAPIGALAAVDDGRLRLLGGFATIDGRAAVIETVDGTPDEGPVLARQLAELLARQRSRLPGAPRVLVTRPAEAAAELASRLGALGVAAIVVPTIAIAPVEPGGPLDDRLRLLASFDWVVATSANAVRAAGDAGRRLGIDLGGARWAVVGRATARALRGAGGSDIWQPREANAAALAAELPLADNARVLVLRGTLADGVAERLRERGAHVEDVVAYRTVEAPTESRPLLAQALADGDLAAVVLASPSQVRGLLELAGQERRAQVAALPAVCIGPTTARAARAAGLNVVGKAPSQEAAALAEFTAEIVARPPARVGP